MKHMNFINALSPAEQKKIANWYRIAWCTAIFLVLGMLACHIRQLYYCMQIRTTYTTLAKTLSSSAQDPNTLKSIQQKHATLQQCCQKLTALKNDFSLYLDGITVLQNTLSHDTTELASWAQRKASFTVSLHTPTTTIATSSIQQLKQLPIIKNIAILSLQPSTLEGKRTIIISARGALQLQTAG